MTSFAVKDCTCGHAEDVDAAPVNMPRIFNIEQISMIPSQCTAFRFHSELCLENLAWRGGGVFKEVTNCSCLTNYSNYFRLAN